MQTHFFHSASGLKLGFIKREGNGPTLVWLCGYHSDFSGQKASIMGEVAQDLGLASLRFDYSGTGTSQGVFEDGTITKWLNEALEIIKAKTDGDLILVGSSMGGWISLRLCQLLKQVKAMVLIAPAPDFTEDLMWDKFPQDVKDEINQNGFWLRPSPYDENGYKVTKELIDSGRENFVLRAPIKFNGPVHILHGKNDADVPWERSPALMDNITSPDITLTLIKNGDHRLSEPEDLKVLAQVLRNIIGKVQS